jgi:transcriptional regulator of arginine metabolism
VSAPARQAAIREILARRVVTSHEDLQRELAARGVAVAQATVSRDLVRLGVTRAAGPDGHRYQIPGADGALPIEPVRPLVDAVLANRDLVVVRTKAGAASTVARAIDDARVGGALGTIAGDDTIFVAPARAGAASDLARRLRKLLG